MNDLARGVDLAALAALEERNRSCAACSLRPCCSQVVVSDGPAQARLVIIGEGPGGEEDRIGRPFVGPAGQLLDRILASAGIERNDVYLTNVVKCRPPGNRDPLPLETVTCTDLWLREQLKLLRPSIILSLGNTPTRHLLQTRRGITDLRGQWVAYSLPSGEAAWLMPMLHPAFLLRRDTREVGGPKSLTWRDIREVAAVLRGEKRPEVSREPEQQPRLF
ncbi:uracil-DNA glycosylase [Deinococcus sp.]|uniref:uracil-DNA glycosylase n=1 Tax=Deinococcus sp. TaxID=47478 RepID=UPI0025C6C09A|nr:uracil-DNA glycosylase [Deinococcus sp.]